MRIYLVNVSKTGGGIVKQLFDVDKIRLYLAGGVSGNLKPLFCKTMKLYLAGNYSRPFVFEEYMKLFLADTGLKQWINDDVWKDNSCYILESFYYADEWIEKHIPLFKDFLLDSGAFTFFSSKPKNVNWEEYVDRYADFINRNKVNHFFELDIDKLIGYDNVLKLRKRLETKTGKQCIPVWHKFRGKENFLSMCDEYKYVAVGGIISGEIPKEKYPIFTYLINEAHKRGSKIHGLGFTNLEGIRKYHFDSVDSTTWTTGNRFGAVYKFNGKTMIKFGKGGGQRLSDSRKVALNNFLEWVKFQKYADIML